MFITAMPHSVKPSLGLLFTGVIRWLSGRLSGPVRWLIKVLIKVLAKPIFLLAFPPPASPRAPPAQIGAALDLTALA